MSGTLKRIPRRPNEHPQTYTWTSSVT
jgi:hypothetical protein